MKVLDGDWTMMHVLVLFVLAWRQRNSTRDKKKQQQIGISYGVT